MRNPFSLCVLSSGLGLILGFGSLSAVAKPSSASLTSELKALKTEITKSLPRADERKSKALESAREEVLKATAVADAASRDLGQIRSGHALVAHAKGKWIVGADIAIVSAKEALAKATNSSERAAAKKALAASEANRKEGEKALAERQAALDAALRNESKFREAHEAAQAALTKAKEDEAKTSNDLLESLGSALSSDKMDAMLAKAVVLTTATPKGLAVFASKGSEQAEMVKNLLGAPTLMKEMLIAGGASHGQYGRTAEILADIYKASPMAVEGHFPRLALAIALEHAKPIGSIDPVKRYLHYEKACLDGELDPAFKSLTTWEYRHVVNCDAPDEILQWGRTMLRTYRPDNIYTPDYGWRYVVTVRTDVPYGSQNVKYDDPSLHQYQNIIRNGGVCGRRAFFGRFILRSFGIPTWGVTQHKHAALSHWTPQGWVVNLGAGYEHSWWDKDEIPLSGNQFLMETQARAHAAGYLTVLRAHWISRVLGEPAYNERQNIEGGYWSKIALYQARMLSSTAAALGPLGQELAEANEREQQKVVSASVSDEDTLISSQDGVITIPVVASAKSSGKAAAMNSIDGGMQMHIYGGYTADYEFDAPAAGKYILTARVATVQTGQKFVITTKGSGQAVPIDVPYTLGIWQPTQAVELKLEPGKNTLHFELVAGSRGVTVKDFTLKAAN